MKKPSMCMALQPVSKEVIAIKWGESGFSRTTYGVQDKEFVNTINREKLGVEPEVAEAMVLCSMFGGWEDFEGRVEIAKKMIEGRKLKPGKKVLFANKKLH